MKKAFAILATLTLFLAPSTVYAEELRLEQVMEGVCRITTIDEDNFGQLGGIRMGTGTVIGKSDNDYLILTNGHVATRTGTKVWVEFFKDGYKSSQIKADVVWRYYQNGSTIDAALVKVSKSSLGSFSPRVINLAPKSFVVKKDDKIYGAGFPAGRWLQSWQARVKRISTNTVSFNMPPEGGQSGSAILSTVILNGKKYTRIIGMVTWRVGNPAYGAGVNLSRLYELFTGDAAPDTIRTHFKKLDVKEAAHGHGHDNICQHCKTKKGKHFVVKYGNGLYKTILGKVQVYCPYQRDEQAARHGANNLVNYEVAFPRKASNRPPIGGGNLSPVPPAPLFPPDVEPDQEPEDKCKKLKEKIAKLESQLKSLSELIVKLEEEGKTSRSVISKLKDTRDELSASLGKTSVLLTSTKEELDKERTLKEQALDKAKGLLNRLNIPFFSQWGGLGNAIAALLAALSSGTLISVVWHKFIYHRMVGKFGWLPTKILERIGKRKLSKYIGNNDEKNGDSGYNNNGGNLNFQKVPPLPFDISLTSTSPDEIVNEKPVLSAPVQEPPMPEGSEPIKVPVDNSISIKDVNVDVNNSVSTTNNYYCQHDDYARQLFGQNHDTLQGWTVDQWAIRAGYYRDAIEAMKCEKLEYKHGVPLLNQLEIADVVEDWVSIRFMAKTKFTCINEIDSKYNKAYLGFLYWEAVQELRDDKFNVLGQVEAASAIERYVRDKFMKVVYKAEED